MVALLTVVQYVDQAVLPEVQVEEVQLVELQEVIQEQEIHLQ